MNRERDRPPMRAIRHVSQDDPLVAPLLAELAVEYSSRYGGTPGEVHADLAGYPAEHFAPPHGALLIVVEDGEPVAGGAFQRFDGQTAELKRIWTARGHRRRGLARLVLTELEAEVARRGYRRIYLTTGERQPEAMALYTAAGYAPLPPFRRFAARHLSHPFVKRVAAGERRRAGDAEAVFA